MLILKEVIILSDFDDVFNDTETNTENLEQAPIDDTDLSGMEQEDAKEYVLAFIQALKETQMKISKLKEELDLWNPRVQLAAERNKPDLKLAAEQKISDLNAEIGMLSKEESELKTKVITLKENLKDLKHKFNFTVDTEQMLADIEMLVGEKDELSEKFKKEEAEKKLEELKRKMDKNGE